MPIAAIPAGVELRKISAVQKRALDELMQNQNGASTKQTALLVGIPAVFLGLGALAFLFRDEIKETIKEEWSGIKEFTEGIPAGALTGTIESGLALGKEITGIDLEATTGRAAEIYGEDIGLCQQYEFDLVELAQRAENAGFFEKPVIGLGIRQKLKGMKKAGCSKPAFTPQEDWNRV
jgi:hypothetical protein